MPGDLMKSLLDLMSVCIRDEWAERTDETGALMAVAFGLGVAASVATTFFLSYLGLL